MEEKVVHIIPPAPTIQDYLVRLWQSIANKPEYVVFSKSTVRQLYKQAYPRAKV